MQIRQGAAPEEVEGRRRVGVRLARKPDHDVGADRRVRQALANVGDHRPVPGRRVRPPHPPQDRVARMLQRKMKMGREPRAGGHQLDHLRRAVHRLERAHPHQEVGRVGGERPQQRGERRRRSQVAAVGTEVDAGQLQLAVPRRDRLVHLVEHPRQRRAPAAPARRRDDAVGARLVAAGLHPQRAGGPASLAGPDRGAAGAVPGTEAHRGGRRDGVQDALGERLLVHVGHDRDDARQGGHLAGGARRVAAGGDDPGAGVGPRDAPNRLPRPLVGARGDRATVDDHDVGRLDGGRGSARGAQAALERERVGLVDAAAERDDGELHRRGVYVTGIKSSAPRIV